MASLDLLDHFDSIKDALDYLDTSALRLMASKYFTYAFFTLLIYDHLLTLEEEIRIIWLGRPSFVKFLFLWNRYTSPLFIAIDIATLSGAFKLSDRVSIRLLTSYWMLNVFSFARRGCRQT
jgi:hypothetical protein